MSFSQKHRLLGHSGRIRQTGQNSRIGVMSGLPTIRPVRVKVDFVSGATQTFLCFDIEKNAQRVAWKSDSCGYSIGCGS